VPDERTQLAGFIGRSGLLRRDLEVVEVQRKWRAVGALAKTHVEHPRGAAVVALLDRSDAPGPYDTNQPGLSQDVDVVRDGALGRLTALASSVTVAARLTAGRSTSTGASGAVSAD